MRIKDNRLYFGDHFAGDLAKEYGTPLYVYEEDVLRARCRELKNLLKRSRLRRQLLHEGQRQRRLAGDSA